jgi:uncharacterized membrane protein (UPF0127 family)
LALYYYGKTVGTATFFRGFKVAFF